MRLKGRVMEISEYKELVIKMLNNIQDETAIKRIYFIVRAMS